MTQCGRFSLRTEETPVKWLLDVLLRRRLWKPSEGQDMVEYALVGGFVAVAAGASRTRRF